MRIALLCGGRSAEREVSLRSGAQVESALRARGHDVRMVDMGPDSWDVLRDGRFDCAFVALHGRMGEDGTVQGVCELLGLPYTGCGVLASSLCIDKTRSNRLLAAAGLAIPTFEELPEGEAVDHLTVERVVATYGLPLVIKPVQEGSTIGITIARDEDAAASGIVLARRYDRRVLVQRFVRGIEVTIGVLATPRVEVLPTLEITYENDTYDYDAKYTPGRSHHIIPARIPEAADAAARDAAARAFAVLGCEGMARVDVIVAADGTPWVLEVNTVPGLTELSLLPDAARAAGISFPELCDRLVQHALVRHGTRVGPGGTRGFRSSIAGWDGGPRSGLASIRAGCARPGSRCRIGRPSVPRTPRRRPTGLPRRPRAGAAPGAGACSRWASRCSRWRRSRSCCPARRSR